MILVQKIFVLIMARMLKMVHEPDVRACSIVQSFPDLCDPMDCSPSGSSVHGILQARILEWGAISFSRTSSQPRDQTSIFFGSCLGRQIL